MVPVAAVVCLAIGGPYLLLGYQHYANFGGVNVAVHSVILFLCINLVICLWELCLCYQHAVIRSTHAKRVKDGQVSYVDMDGTAVLLCWEFHRLQQGTALSLSTDLRYDAAVVLLVSLIRVCPTCNILRTFSCDTKLAS